MVIYKNSFTLAATLDTDIHHSKHCINFALPTLVPVLNSPVQKVQSDPAEKRRGVVHHQVRYEHPFQGCYIYS